MSLSDRLARAEPSVRGRLCAVGLVLGVLLKADADALRLALAVPNDDRCRLSALTISKILAEEGHEVGSQSIVKHRNGRCRCGFIRETGSA